MPAGLMREDESSLFVLWQHSAYSDKEPLHSQEIFSIGRMAGPIFSP
ncbi:hypothetical protein SJDPG4_00740 [Porphyromonas gingivalis SJD4]|nr:hypothetical protein SJDPG4_00740 [Porphyromonas gingivalis SJD4]